MARVAGEIVVGDAEAFRLEVNRAEIGGYIISEIQLNSIGGRLFGAKHRLLRLG
jgi:hypothetical protein